MSSSTYESTANTTGRVDPCMSSADVANSSEGELCTTDMDGLKRLCVVVVPIAGVLLISLVFLTVVCVYNRVKRKDSMRYIYEIKPKTKDESTFTIRSRGTLQLNYAHAGSREYVNVVKELRLEQLASQHFCSTRRIDNEPPLIKAASEESGNFNCQNVCQKSTRRDSKSIAHSCHSNSRSSIRNGHRIQDCNNEEHEDAGGFSRQQSIQVSTLSEAGLNKNGLNTIQVHASIEGSDCYVNPTEKRSTHQEHMHNQHQESEIFVTGLQINTSKFGNVPSFTDPEWVSDGNQDTVNLEIPTQPDIYSSQILETVASFRKVPENKDIYHSDLDFREPSACTLSNGSNKSLDRIISMLPHTHDDFKSMEPLHGSALVSCNPHLRLEDSEALYDQVTFKSSIKDNQIPPVDTGYDRLSRGLAQKKNTALLQEPLFDDPSYERRFKVLPVTVTQDTSQGHCSPSPKRTHTPFSTVAITIEMHGEEEETML